MRRIAVLFLLLLITAVCYAGIDEFYSFTATTGTYTPITGTAITNILLDDALSAAIPLGFSFPYGDLSFTNVKVSSNGWVGLGDAQTGSNLSNQLAGTGTIPVLAPLWDDTSLSGGSSSYLLSGTTPNRIFTIQFTDLQWNYSADNSYNFQVKMYETGKVEFVYGTATGTPNFPSASIGINMSPGGAGWYYSYTIGIGVSSTIENANIITFPTSGTVLQFVPVVASPNDLTAQNIIGNTTPSVGAATNYSVTVRNRGSSPQSTYTVAIVNSAGTTLASVPGTTLQSNATATFTVPWTPATEGPMAIRGKAILPGDANPSNDFSPALNITVMPAGMMAVTIGAGDIMARVPVDMYWRNSLFETIYYPEEIGAYGNISALTFYNNFVINLPDKPTKIWLGTTTQADLSAGWVPSTQLTLVYDSTVNYPSGQNAIMVPLQTPYVYAGGNLVMMVNRPMDTTYFNSQDYFLAQTVGTTRSRNIQADGTEYDPAAPPPEAFLSGTFPKTTLHLTPLGPNPIFMVNPTSKNYGTVLLNTLQNQTFTIINAGGGTLGINSISIAGDPQYTLQGMPTLPASLNTGQSITFVGRYSPTAVGSPTATITINDNLTTRSDMRSSPNRTAHTIALSGTCIDPTIVAMPYMQSFDTVTAPAIPITWSKKIITTNNAATIVTTTNTPFSDPNCVQLYNNSDAAATVILIAPPVANTIPINTLCTKIKAKISGINVPLIIGVMTNPQDAATFTAVQTITLTNTWAEYVVTLAGYAGTGKYVAYKHGSSSSYQDIYLDDILIELTPQNDLAALSIAGNITPSVEMVSSYTVNVFNWGSNAQNTYTVKLFKAGDIEVGSIAGTTVNPGQTVQVVVPWTPTTAGATSIYGKVVLTGDQNTLNDACAPFNVFVQPVGNIAFTIGAGDQLARRPVDMYYQNSLFETLYYPAELGNTIGTINGVGFYNTFQTNLPNMPTKVWIGTTTQADLTAGWIPSTQLTLVYDGTINYPAGTNTINIPFQTPYLYLNSQNIVLMVQRPMDTGYYSPSDQFYCQTGTQARARNAYADDTPFDPTAPPDATADAQFPKTTFFVIPGGVGHLNGTILGAGGVPLAGVAVHFATGGYATTTNAQGQYSIQNILHASYQVSFSHHGYITNTQTVVIPEDQTIVLNLNLVPMPTVNVTGTIFASNTGAGLAGAGIHLDGYDNYTVTTSAAGTFTIPSVYGVNSYAYSIICSGYQNTTGTINVGATNYSMGTITLSEIAYAPAHVNAAITTNTSVMVMWQAPDPTALEITESFEAINFPPDNWSHAVTNTGAANTSNVYPTWCSFDGISINGTPVNPTEGSKQAGLWWNLNHQDEWLITPQFNCPPSSYLTFDTYATLGSINGDHYYVKVSSNNGGDWTVLWDATAQAAGHNYYEAPITIDLSQYEGLAIKIAWHAVDSAANDGLYYVWFIDNVYIGNAATAVRFPRGSYTTRSGDLKAVPLMAMTPTTDASRAVEMGYARSKPLRNTVPWIGKQIGDNSVRTISYKVWRLQAGQETDEGTWTLLTPTVQAGTNFTDSAWGSLSDATYRWAVKAIYTGNVVSVPSFSNPIVHEVLFGSIAGVCRNPQNQTVSGVTVTAGTYTATTNNSGAYNLALPTGTYTVRAAKNGYLSVVNQNVLVNNNAVTTLNFTMVPGVGNDDEVIPIVATELNGNYPNPFNPETTISYAIKDRAPVRLEIFNTKGQLVRTLVNQEQASGRYSTVWNGRDNANNAVSSGMYFYRMNAGTYSSTRKMLLMQ